MKGISFTSIILFNFFNNLPGGMKYWYLNSKDQARCFYS